MYRGKPILHLVFVGLLLFFVIAPPVHAAPQTQENSLVDVEWYRENLIHSADLWNGGLDGVSGMGAYQEDFNGFFHVTLDQQWNQMRMRSSTTVAQSRGIYMNVEAYRAAGPDEGARFLEAVNQGVAFLLEEFKDDELGGFYWEVSRTGLVTNDQKHGYGNVHPLFALAHAYSVTQNPAHLEAALEQYEVLKTRFLDPRYLAAILPGFNRDFTEVVGVNNIDTFTHWFEALLALYDVTEGDIQAEIGVGIVYHGNFLVRHLYHDQEGFTDRGYVAYNYDEYWQPSQIPYSRENQWSGGLHATTGHNIELAYLLSRAVERGFDEDWLEVADKLLKFCVEYALHPVYGGMIYEATDYAGLPLEGNPDNPLFIWWAQAETARAFLHFMVVRGHDYLAEFMAVETLFHDHLTDQEYGGLYHALDAENDLAPVNPNKGDVWKVCYHYAMFFAEVLRLGEFYPEQLTELNAMAAAVQ